MAIIAEVLNETEVPIPPLNLCGMHPDFSDPKQLQHDDGLREEFARLFSCKTCLGKRKQPSAFEFSSEDTESILREFTVGLVQITNGREIVQEPEKLQLIGSCPWASYDSAIGKAVLKACEVKAIDGSLVISENMPHPIREAVVEYSRIRNVAHNFLANQRHKKREAERRLKDAHRG